MDFKLKWRMYVTKHIIEHGALHVGSLRIEKSDLKNAFRSANIAGNVCARRPAKHHAVCLLHQRR